MESGKGKLTVFFGMARGVGKTSTMLAEARDEHAAGRDVVVGYLETYGRLEISSQIKDLPIIPVVHTLSRDRVLTDLNLDALLERQPELVVIDELACGNGPLSRHPKRYQDVQELLDAQIDVFTTLNVANVESCGEAVRQITGSAILETIPDTVLDSAEFVLVDLPPDQLLGRLRSDDLYAHEAALAAQRQVFRPGSLSALRELALRYVAEHVSRNLLACRQANGSQEPWKSRERLLVAVSSSSSSGALIRWARRAAGETHATWVAAHVELRRPLSNVERSRLAGHLSLAKDLGAQVITTSDHDLVRGLLRVAREQNVTRVVLGKPTGRSLLDRWRANSLLNRLVSASGEIDVHMIRAVNPSPKRGLGFPRFTAALARECGLVLFILTGTSLVNEVLRKWIGYQPLGLIYLLGVVIASMLVSRGPAIAAAISSALALDYLFQAPVYSFRITNPVDVAVFCTYVTVAIIVGNLTARLRERELAERQRERHATGLYLLTRSLAQASHFTDLLAIVTEEVGKACHVEVALAIPDGKPRDNSLQAYSGSTWKLSDSDLNLACWAFGHSQPAGQGTATQPSAEGLHLPLLAGDRALGVLSIRFGVDSHITPDLRDLLDSFARQIAIALDRQRLRDAEQQAELVAESERLSKTLLNSVSHEIRTPLSAITSAASSLSDAPEDASPQWRRTMAEEIQEAAQRLNRLVGNLLNMTRLETGHVKPKLDWCDVNDLIQVTVEDIKPELSRHILSVEVASELPLVRMDFVLMQQVLTNLLLNAALHTPAGTQVSLAVDVDASELVVAVSDNGPGLPRDALTQIFGKFYRAPTAPVGGTGLGLAIVKGYVEALLSPSAFLSRAPNSPCLLADYSQTPLCNESDRPHHR
jgi:two-component system sensor histidine kinase KdpD